MNEDANMMKNSNEIRPPRTPGTEDGIGVRDPHTLHNNFLTNASEDDLCTKCKQKAYYKIMGGENCYYCGNEIRLCKGHYVKLFVEMSEVRDFGLIKEAAQDFEERQKVGKR